MLNDIVHITEENFAEIDPTLLVDSRWYQEVENMVASITAADSADYASDYATMLSEKLLAVGDKLPQELGGKYLRLLKVLKLCGLQVISDQEKEKFFKEQFIDLLNVDFIDIKEKAELLFRGYSDVQEMIEGWRNLFLRSLDKNQEMIGQNNLTVTISGDEKVVKPNTQNWLMDYNSSVHIDPATHKRSGFEQTNYMLHSANVQKLSKGDRQVLLKVIQFYDWLKFDSLHYDFRLPGQPAWEDKLIEISEDEPEKLIPDDLREMIEKMRAEKAAKGGAAAQTDYMKAEKFVMPKGQELGSRNYELGEKQPPLPQSSLVSEETVKAKPPVVPRKPKEPEVRIKKQELKEETGVIQDGGLAVTNPLIKPLKPVLPQTNQSVARVPKENESEWHTSMNVGGQEIDMPMRPVNIQDILNRKNTLDNKDSGLKIGGGENSQFPIPNSQTKSKIAEKSTLPGLQKTQTEAKPEPELSLKGSDSYYQDAQKERKQKDIERKLEELKKRVKN